MLLPTPNCNLRLQGLVTIFIHTLTLYTYSHPTSICAAAGPRKAHTGDPRGGGCANPSAQLWSSVPVCRNKRRPGARIRCHSGGADARVLRHVRRAALLHRCHGFYDNNGRRRRAGIIIVCGPSGTRLYCSECDGQPSSGHMRARGVIVALLELVGFLSRIAVGKAERRGRVDVGRPRWGRCCVHGVRATSTSAWDGFTLLSISIVCGDIYVAPWRCQQRRCSEKAAAAVARCSRILLLGHRVPQSSA